MTIFMGIKTKNSVFGAIDGRITLISKTGKVVGFLDERPKLYQLEHQNMSFAVIGKLLTANLPFQNTTEMGVQVREKVGEMKTKLYRKAINTITSEYRKAYAKQVSNPQDNETFVMIWGYNPNTFTPFLYKCESPEFKPEEIPLNEAFILGYDDDVYKRNSLKIFQQLCLNQPVNMWQWAKQTFASHPNNQYVNYPLGMHMYKRGFLPWKCISLGDSIANQNVTRKEGDPYLSKFDIKLKHMR